MTINTFTNKQCNIIKLSKAYIILILSSNFQKFGFIFYLLKTEPFRITCYLIKCHLHMLETQGHKPHPQLSNR